MISNEDWNFEILWSAAWSYLNLHLFDFILNLE